MNPNPLLKKARDLLLVFESKKDQESKNKKALARKAEELVQEMKDYEELHNLLK